MKSHPLSIRIQRPGLLDFCHIASERWQFSYIHSAEVKILPCFGIMEIGFSTEDMDRFDSYAAKWEKLYKSYREDMSGALNERGEGASEVTNYYLQVNKPLNHKLMQTRCLLFLN